MEKSGNNKPSVCYPITILILCGACLMLISCVFYLRRHQEICDRFFAENGLKNRNSLMTNNNAVEEPIIFQFQPTSSEILEIDYEIGPIGPIGPAKVTLGTVVCYTLGDSSPREEALIMMKSAVTSAILYANVASLEFHLFLEHPEYDEDFFIDNMQQITNLYHDLQVELYFYEVFDIVPEEYHASMLYSGDQRCGDVHIFFPDALEEIDSILYVDTDTIFTGSIAEVWGHLRHMEKRELIGATLDIEPDNQAYLEKYQVDFNEVPIPPTRRVNTGVLLMKLKGMREYGWVNKLLQLKKDYGKLIHNMDDQRLVNTLLFYNADLLHLLPCQYNFRPLACNLGMYCNGALEDPLGIQILHQYQKREIQDGSNAFRDVADAFENVSLSDPNENLVSTLLTPIRSYYMAGKLVASPTHGSCDGILDSLLFKHFFPFQ